MLRLKTRSRSKSKHILGLCPVQGKAHSTTGEPPPLSHGTRQDQDFAPLLQIRLRCAASPVCGVNSAAEINLPVHPVRQALAFVSEAPQANQASSSLVAASANSRMEPKTKSVCGMVPGSLAAPKPFCSWRR